MGKKETYANNVVGALQRIRAEGQDIWLHAAFSFKHGLLKFRPYTEFEYSWLESDDALLDFIVRLNMSVSDFITDKIDLRRYLPALINHGLIDVAEAYGSPMSVEEFNRD